jgi:DMSO/TMAO reductase YedYZ heme-binding membrane subunit
LLIITLTKSLHRIISVATPIHSQSLYLYLTLILLTWRIWWARINARKRQMGFNWAFKVLKSLSVL